MLEWSELEPGRVPTAHAHRIVLVRGEGRRDAQAAVRRAFVRHAAKAGVFEVEERIARRAGRPKPGEIMLQLNVLEWEPESWPTDTGARIVLEAVVTTAAGAVRTATIEGQAPASAGSAGRGSAPGDATENAAAALLDALTPRRVTRRLRLDDRDGGQDRMLRAALEGRIARAHEDLRRYGERHPQNAAAAYNLAVLTEALGRYDEALRCYDRALALDDKPLYRRARQACKDVLDRSQAHVSQEPGRN